MDILVVGTNPQVYDPPKTPPFSKKKVFARLKPVARRLQFTARNPLAPVPATYEGLLPCADCPGIEYRLNLLSGHRYKLRLDYQDRDAVFDQSGRWHLSKDRQTLTLSGKRQWAVLDGGRQLRMLNSEGNAIHSGLNYDLTRSAHFRPLSSGEH
jgi:uncharacterized lipoprotein NlpE involved in copper resistance